MAVNPIRVVSRLRQPSRLPLLQVVKTSLAVVVSWTVAYFVVGQALPIFAAIASLLEDLRRIREELVEPADA